MMMKMAQTVGHSSKERSDEENRMNLMNNQNQIRITSEVILIVSLPFFDYVSTFNECEMNCKSPRIQTEFDNFSKTS